MRLFENNSTPVIGALTLCGCDSRLYPTHLTYNMVLAELPVSEKQEPFVVGRFNRVSIRLAASAARDWKL